MSDTDTERDTEIERRVQGIMMAILYGVEGPVDLDAELRRLYHIEYAQMDSDSALAKCEADLAAERAAHEATRAALEWERQERRMVGGDYVKAHLQASALDEAWGKEQTAHEATKARLEACVEKCTRISLARFSERAELARVTADGEAKTARLRNAESAYQALVEEVRATVDALGVPSSDDLHQCLAWLRDNAMRGKAVSA
ncbi:MAG: hypothetical protein WC683_08145 [bacterium]